MSDLLFGWITRPRHLVSFLDVVVASIGVLILAFIWIRFINK